MRRRPYRHARSLPTTAVLLLAVLLPTAGAQEERAPRAWLGVTLGEVVPRPTAEEDAPPADVDPRGARISGVVRESPAARAGLRAGDVVLAIDGQAVDAPAALIAAVGALDPGTWVELAIERRGRERTVSARLDDRPALARQLEIRRGWSGMRLVDVPRQLQEFWGGEGGYGVLVGEVTDGSPAQIGGVLPGDLVLSIDGEPVRGIFELLPRLRGGGIGNEIELEISRQGTMLDVSVELADEPPPEELEERERGPRRRSRLDDDTLRRATVRAGQEGYVVVSEPASLEAFVIVDENGVEVDPER